MMLIPARLCCICLTVTTVVAFPTIRQTSTSLPNVKSFCTSLALKTILKGRQSQLLGDTADIPTDIPNDYSYMTSGIPNEIPYVTSGFGEDYPFENIDSGIPDSVRAFADLLTGINTKDNFESFSTDKYITKLSGKIEYLRNKCVSRLLRTSAVNGGDEKVGEPRQLIGGDEDFSNGGFPARSEHNAQPGSGGKRSDLGLNPTGWRKRRSDDDSERLQQFLRNVRQLLEKRKRLEFNPTGW